ncbi:hypothetical protein HaLaN_12663, partial [Haematococcus lacustris]
MSVKHWPPSQKLLESLLTEYSRSFSAGYQPPQLFSDTEDFKAGTKAYHNMSAACFGVAYDPGGGA